jgi:hypothetical protein
MGCGAWSNCASNGSRSTPNQLKWLPAEFAPDGRFLLASRCTILSPAANVVPGVPDFIVEYGTDTTLSRNSRRHSALRTHRSLVPRCSSLVWPEHRSCAVPGRPMRVSIATGAVKSCSHWMSASFQECPNTALLEMKRRAMTRHLAGSRTADYSITSSACARRDGGTESPAAAAVFRLITSSNRVGCMRGRSATIAQNAAALECPPADMRWLSSRHSS